MNFYSINLCSCTLSSCELVTSTAFYIKEFRSLSICCGKRYSCFQLMFFNFVFFFFLKKKGDYSFFGMYVHLFPFTCGFIILHMPYYLNFLLNWRDLVKLVSVIETSFMSWFSLAFFASSLVLCFCDRSVSEMDSSEMLLLFQ